MNNLISIIIPVKNGENYLVECLESIINQTVSNWELLIVNDNSTDGTWELLNEYASKNSNISIFNNIQNGIINALKLAYSHSKGNLITRMDADDIMSLNKLEILSNNLIQNGKGFLATGKVSYFSENELGEGYKNYAIWLNKLTEKAINYSEIYKECVIPSPCWMVFREDLNKCGAFNSDIYPEDYDLCFRFYKNNLIVVSSNETLHFWRDYSTRTSRTDSNYEDNFFLKLKMKYFLELNYNSNRKLQLWGAGNKGKEIARYLIDKNIDFEWFSNNVKKIGKDVYGKIILSEKEVFSKNNPQIIIAIGILKEQDTLKSIFKSKDLLPNLDYFFFS